MWLIAQVSVALSAAQPASDAYIEMACPWLPIFFTNGVTELSEAARSQMDTGGFLSFQNLEGGGDTRIILRTYTKGEPLSEVGRLSEARADAVRAALIERHISPDHIMISHTYGSELHVVDEGWVGGWIYPEYYVTRAFRDHWFPRGGPVC
jgi:hypothetical protein